MHGGEKEIWTFRIDAETARIWEKVRAECYKNGVLPPNRTGLLISGFRNELSKLINDKGIIEELREITGLEEAERRYDLSLRRSKMMMRTAGWGIQVRNAIEAWIEKNGSIPPKEVVDAWVMNGVALGYSQKQARKAVRGYLERKRKERLAEFRIGRSRIRRQGIRRQKSLRMVRA